MNLVASQKQACVLKCASSHPTIKVEVVGGVELHLLTPARISISIPVSIRLLAGHLGD